MPPAYGNIKALHAGKNDKGIILRLVRKYVVPDFYGGKNSASLECIFHDDENDKGIILRLVRKYVVPDFYGGKNPASLECIFHNDEYLTNTAATMMGTTSRFITLQTPEPQAYQVYYEYRAVGNKKRSSIMIRLTDGWSAVAEQLLLERGNAVRIKLCDKLHDCFHIIQIPIIKIDIDHTYHYLALA